MLGLDLRQLGEAFMRRRKLATLLAGPVAILLVVALVVSMGDNGPTKGKTSGGQTVIGPGRTDLPMSQQSTATTIGQPSSVPVTHRSQGSPGGSTPQLGSGILGYSSSTPGKLGPPSSNLSGPDTSTTTPVSSQQGTTRAPSVDVFVNDGNWLKQISAGTGTVTTLFSVQLPTALAADTHGYLYYGSAMNDSVSKEPVAGGQQPTYVIQEGSPMTGIAVDVSGDVAFDCSGCFGPGQVTPATNQQQSPRSNECSVPAAPASCFPSRNAAEEGIAYDSNGDVFWVDPGNNRVVKVPSGGGPESDVGSGLQSPFGVATDESGDVFISDALGVLKVPADGGPQVRIGSGLKPSGIAADAAGDVFVADTGNHRVVEIPADDQSQFTIAQLQDPMVVAVVDPFDTKPWTQ